MSRSTMASFARTTFGKSYVLRAWTYKASSCLWYNDCSPVRWLQFRRTWRERFLLWVLINSALTIIIVWSWLCWHLVGLCPIYVGIVWFDCDDDRLDPIDREPVSIPSNIHNKDGVYHCKKHSSPSTSRVYIPLIDDRWYCIYLPSTRSVQQLLRVWLTRRIITSRPTHSSDPLW